MKVTFMPKERKVNKVPFDEIPVGMVYIAECETGPVALKLEGGEAALLTYVNNDDWFVLADGYKGTPAYKILGKLTEIIVKRYKYD